LWKASLPTHQPGSSAEKKFQIPTPNIQKNFKLQTSNFREASSLKVQCCSVAGLGGNFVYSTLKQLHAETNPECVMPRWR
jgi:hypothetical protein